jgi:hypothetical protein
MGTFGSGVFGGPGGDGTGGSAGVPLSSLLQPMLRMAGITVLPGTTPNVDQYGELVPMVNRLLGSWNCDGHKIFTTSISDPFPLTSGQKIYTIGPGGDFDTDRPMYVKGATVLFPTGPVLRRELRILDDEEWRAIAIQDIVGAPPYELYYDGGFDENGLASIYLRFQPPDGYSLELYTWQRLQTSFTSAADIAIFPPGYERAIVLNGALEVAALYPLEAKIAPIVPGLAAQALRDLMVLNMRCPKIGTEAGLGGGDYDDEPVGRGWLTGGFK